MTLPLCDVIVPTQALAERASLLREALGSIQRQEAVRARPLVIINGGVAEPALQRELERDARLRVLVLAEGHLPNALRFGRGQVTAPFFAALDDDDVLLPGALAARLAALEADPALDVVVTNGYRQEASGQVLHVKDVASVQADPLAALMHANWLLPGSWLCRSERVGTNLFDPMPRFLENTYLALRFAASFRMTFLAEPTVIWRTDTARSMSKSREFWLGQVPALRALTALSPPGAIRAGFERHLTKALHAEAELHLQWRERREAWRCHLASLRRPGGWRYLPFTRHLLRPGTTG